MAYPLQQPDSSRIFDRSRVRAQRRRAMPQIENHNFLFNRAAENIADRLLDITHSFPRGLIIGNRASQICLRSIKRNGRIEELIVMDLAENPDKVSQDISFVQGDEECLPFGKDTLDMVLSPLGLHSVNDLPGTLLQIRQALKPDGLFIAAVFGRETLHELRHCLMQAELITMEGVSPRIAPFADKQQLGALMQRTGFALPVVDSENIRVSYECLDKLLHDLRGMGEGNALQARLSKPVPRKFFEIAEDIYRNEFADENGRINATFEIIFMTGWAPHESQQRPLRPGSAEKRLAEFLNTEEKNF